MQTTTIDLTADVIDVLEDCERNMLISTTADMSRLDRIRAAIAKAKGRVSMSTQHTQDIAAERDRLKEINADLLEALEYMVGPRIDLANAICHRGITTAEKCGQCSKELKARAAIAKATISN